MRKTLDHQKIHSAALGVINGFHSDFVKEVEDAVKSHEWVIVGMAQNPVVKKARGLLAARSLPYHYIEHGNYFTGWKKRLAVKLWSGWPTFPQIFHNGLLIGGAADLERYLTKG